MARSRSPVPRSSADRPRGTRRRRPAEDDRRVGFFGPIPYLSARTRRGTRVRVGGCCLPIPLGLLAALGATVAATRLAVRRRPGAASVRARPPRS